jgi:hypothetical protein
MTCPSGLHGAVWCSCRPTVIKSAEQQTYENAKMFKNFFQDVTAGSVVRDYEYRHEQPKFWSGWRWERGHKCDGGEIKAGQSYCGVCY